MPRVPGEQLHAAWLCELRRCWQDFNKRHLGETLTPPVFQIDGGSQRLGHWEREARILSLAHAHIWSHAWDDVLATLKHEMAHQYVDERLGGEDRPHGPLFARACRLLGIDPDASGAPRPASAADEPNRILRRVQKLLALATSANRHEAEAAMAAANTLLLRHNLERPPADHAALAYAARRLGSSAAALPLDWKLVGAILGEFFFVECIWASTYNARRDRHERALEVLGSAANLEIASYVHDFLHASVDRLWRREAGEHGLLPTHRREYAAGVLLGFRDKLRSERARNAEVGLVWLGDPDLERFTRDRHPHLRSMAKTGVRRSRAHEAGRAAGQRLTLQKPVHEHQSRGRALREAG
ncbi:MAG: DUF2786 domain-containing protein [Myxococcales bacterium]|nr:DUF2786 domain-containing protein [Myxococcales bacterium]